MSMQERDHQPDALAALLRSPRSLLHLTALALAIVANFTNALVVLPGDSSYSSMSLEELLIGGRPNVALIRYLLPILVGLAIAASSAPRSARFTRIFDLLATVTGIVILVLGLGSFDSLAQALDRANQSSFSGVIHKPFQLGPAIYAVAVTTILSGIQLLPRLPSLSRLRGTSE
jgi:hypothetical protein